MRHAQITQSTTRNQLLMALTPDAFAKLQPRLEFIDLPLRMRVEAPFKSIPFAIFPERGIISVVARAPDNHEIEVGIIGREGATALPVVMATDRSPNDTFVQLAGDGWRIPVPDLRELLEASSQLRSVLQRFAHVFLIQAAHTALANGRGSIEERLARWLVMGHDRIDTDELNLTHEFIAVMLGVRRAGVSTALDRLEGLGLVSNKRGLIVVLDRDGLIAKSNGLYGAPEAEYCRVFGGKDADLETVD